MELISACLLGSNTKWSAENAILENVEKLIWESEGLIPICPEQLGGLPTSRERARITDGDGHEILPGKREF